MATVDPLLSAYMCDTNTLEIFQADISNINQVFICVSQSEGEIKAAIQALQKIDQELDSGSGRTSTLSTEESCDVSLSGIQLNDELTHAQELHDRLEAEIKSLQIHLDGSMVRLEEFKTEEQKMKSENSAKIPKAKSVLDLYKHISMLRFHMDVPKDEVKGYVCNTNNVLTFTLNKKNNSQHFITNHLWDLMRI